MPCPTRVPRLPSPPAAPLQPMLRLLQMLPAAARAQMVRMYGQLLGEQLHSVGDALANLAGPPPAQLVDLLHKIAGSAAMMQDQDLSLPARAMEAALRDGRPADAVAAWPAMVAAAHRTLAALQAMEAG